MEELRVSHSVADPECSLCDYLCIRICVTSRKYEKIHVLWLRDDSALVLEPFPKEFIVCENLNYMGRFGKGKGRNI